MCWGGVVLTWGGNTQMKSSAIQGTDMEPCCIGLDHLVGYSFFLGSPVWPGFSFRIPPGEIDSPVQSTLGSNRRSRCGTSRALDQKFSHPPEGKRMLGSGPSRVWGFEENQLEGVGGRGGGGGLGGGGWEGVILHPLSGIRHAGQCRRICGKQTRQVFSVQTVPQNAHVFSRPVFRSD